MTKTTASLVFLLGTPRSGTTLLAHLLQRHPDIVAPPEPWIMLALQAFGQTSSHHPANPELLARAMRELWGRVDATAALRALADRVYDDYRAKSGKRLLVDKTPRYWMILDFLDVLYPDAPRIVLIRNPYAVAASLKTTWGVKLHPMNWEDPDQLRYLSDLALGFPRLHELTKRPGVVTVRYEDLVTNPSAELSRLLLHLGCTNGSVDLEVGDDLDYLVNSAFGDRKILARPKVGPESLEPWRDQLDDSDLWAVTDLLGGEKIERLGYGSTLADIVACGMLRKRPGEEGANRARLRAWHESERRKAERASSAVVAQARDAVLDRLTAALAASEADRSRLHARQQRMLADQLVFHRDVTRSRWHRIGRLFGFSRSLDVPPWDTAEEPSPPQAADGPAGSAGSEKPQLSQAPLLTTTFSQHGEDVFVAQNLPSDLPRIVVDVGANDGQSWSNSRLFGLSGWRLLLIEPMPIYAERCRQLYADRDDVVVEQLAISDGTGTVEFHISQDSEQDQLAMRSSLLRDMVPSSDVQTVTVRTDTLRNVLLRHDIPQDFAFLNVDAEGLDLAVLQSADLAFFRPHVICVEEGSGDVTIMAYLASFGYRRIQQLGPNGIYVRAATQ